MDSSLEGRVHMHPLSLCIAHCGLQLGPSLIVICRPRKYFLTVELYQIRCAHSSLSWIQAWNGTCAHASPQSAQCVTGSSNCVCRPRKYFLTVELYQIRCAHSSLSWIQAWRDVCTCIPSVCAMRTGFLIVFAVQESTS